MKGLGFNLLKYTEGLTVGKSVISVCKSDLKRQTEGFYGSEKVAKISHFSDLFTILRLYFQQLRVQSSQLVM